MGIRGSFLSEILSALMHFDEGLDRFCVAFFLVVSPIFVRFLMFFLVQKGAILGHSAVKNHVSLDESGPFLFIFKSFLDHFWDHFGPFSDHFGIILGFFFDHFGALFR